MAVVNATCLFHVRLKKHGLLQVVVALENKVALFLEKNISSMQKSVNRKSLY